MPRIQSQQRLAAQYTLSYMGATASAVSAAQGWRWQLRVWLLAAAGLAIRGGCLLWLGPARGGDTNDYLQSATLLLGQPWQWLAGVPANPSPLFDAWLAFCHFIWPAQPLKAAADAQVLVSALAIVAIGSAVRQGWGETAGLLSASVAAIFPDFIFWSRYILTDTLGLVLLAVVADQFSRTCASSKPLRQAALLVLLLALLVLCRQAMVTLWLALPLAIVWVRRKSGLPAAAPAVVAAAPLILGIMLLLASPGLRSLAGKQLWQQVWIGMQWTPAGRGTIGADVGQPPPPELRGLTTQQVATILLERQPLHYARLDVLKALYFWTPVLPGWSLRHALITGSLVSAASALAIAGLLAKPVSSGPRVFALLAMVVFTVTSMLTITDFDQRYRLPASVGVVMLAGAGAELLWMRWRSRRAASAQVQATLAPEARPAAEAASKPAAPLIT
jgi:hypothetical protein